MNKDKPYQIIINERGQLDIIDHIESKKKNVTCIYNDLGVPPFSAAEAICDLLNEKEEENRKLKQKIEFISKELCDCERIIFMKNISEG